MGFSIKQGGIGHLGLKAGTGNGLGSLWSGARQQKPGQARSGGPGLPGATCQEQCLLPVTPFPLHVMAPTPRHPRLGRWPHEEGWPAGGDALHQNKGGKEQKHSSASGRTEVRWEG